MSLISLSIFLNLFEEFVCKYYLFKINFIHTILFTYLFVSVDSNLPERKFANWFIRASGDARSSVGRDPSTFNGISAFRHKMGG